MTRVRKALKWTTVALFAAMTLANFIPVAAQVYTAYSALDGTQFAPAYSFNSATNTGLSRDTASGAPQMSTAGALIMRWLGAGPIIGGQVRLGLSTPPTINSCGTATVSGTDTAGQVVITGGTPSTCTVNFAATWAKAPYCFASTNRAASQAPTVTASTTVLTMVMATTFTGQAANFGTDTIGYHCESN